jgi:hypothetical protein
VESDRSVSASANVDQGTTQQKRQDQSSTNPGEFWDGAARYAWSINWDTIPATLKYNMDASASQHSFVPESGTQISEVGEVQITGFNAPFNGFGGEGRARSQLYAVFDLNEPHDFAISGSITITGPVTRNVSTVVKLSGGDVGTIVEVGTDGPFSFAGTLSPGRYLIESDMHFSNEASTYAARTWNFTLDITPAAVPEPTSLALLGACCLAATARRRSRLGAQTLHPGPPPLAHAEFNFLSA